MKFSYCSIAFRNQNICLTDIIPFLAREGYDGIELWANHLTNNTDLVALKKTLDDCNLSVPMIAPYFDLTSTAQKWEQSLKTAKKFIDIAAFLHTPLIRAFTGVIGSKAATEKQKTDCIEGLKIMCEQAASKDVSIALETHPQTLVDDVESTLWLLEKVDAANLKINLDIYHMFEVHNDPLWALDTLLPHVAHVHAKNAVLSQEEHHRSNHPLLHDPNPKAIFLGVRPLADGEMDYHTFINSLQSSKYKGFVSVEWFGDDPLTAATTELKFLKSICHPRGRGPKDLEILR